MTEKRNTFRFVGELTAQSGLAVTRMGETYASPAGSKLRLSNKAQRLPRLGPLREDAQAYFPATSIRGALRRAGRNYLRRQVAKQTGNPTPWSVDTHYMLTQGVDTTNKVGDDKKPGTIDEEEALRSENPFLSLFGRWQLPGHVGIDNAIPHSADCVYVEGRGARSNDFVRSPEQVQFLSEDELERLKGVLEDDQLAAKETGDIDEEIKALKVELRKLNDADEKQEVQEQIKAKEALKKDVKAAKKGSSESIQRPIEGFEAIVPGTAMTHRMMLQNANDMELGLFLATLREFARSPYVGGHRALHCGEVSGQWIVKTWPEDQPAPVNLGTVKVSSDGFEISDEPVSETLSKALKTWDEAASNLSESGFDFERYLLVA